MVHLLQQLLQSLNEICMLCKLQQYALYETMKCLMNAHTNNFLQVSDGECLALKPMSCPHTH